ncbi:MAG TPA: flavodoxin family protein [Phycisphaerae bacterium]|nr:flavodoxin family protein [Phycisphaerae bacterium]
MNESPDGTQTTVDPGAVRPATRAVVLNGALPGDETLAPIESVLLELLRETGAGVRDFQLRDIPLAHCQGCFECWLETPGLCKTDGDAGREITGAMIGSDVLVLLTPVTFGGYSSEIKKAMDRSICMVSPFFRRVDGEVHHKLRYRRYPALAAVGVLHEPDEEQERIFGTLVERNALNFASPATAVCVLPAGAPPSVVRDRLASGLEPVLGHLARRVA